MMASQTIRVLLFLSRRFDVHQIMSMSYQANCLQVMQRTVGPVDPIFVCPLLQLFYHKMGPTVRGDVSEYQAFCKSNGLQCWQRYCERDKFMSRGVNFINTNHCSPIKEGLAALLPNLPSIVSTDRLDLPRGSSYTSFSKQKLQLLGIMTPPQHHGFFSTWAYQASTEVAKNEG